VARLVLGADRPGRWIPTVGVAAAVAAATVTAVVVPLALRGAAPGSAGAGAPGISAAAGSATATGRAVPVEGVGHLLRDTDGQIRLCSLAFTPGVKGAEPLCAGDRIAVAGADDAMVSANPGRIRIEGTYRAGMLSLSRVIGPAPEESSAADPPLPCATPRGGWARGNGFPDGDDHDARAGVDRLTRAQPQRYGQAWTWGTGSDPPAPGEVDPKVSVVVVGTTGDVARARADLSAVYGGNLCVHPVRYGAADLDRIVQRLTSAGITAGVDVRLSKVRVSVVVLDPPTAALLEEVGRDALIVEEPMLQWLE
jgi:hypothetical protein